MKVNWKPSSALSVPSDWANVKSMDFSIPGYTLEFNHTLKYQTFVIGIGEISNLTPWCALTLHFKIGCS